MSFSQAQTDVNEQNNICNNIRDTSVLYQEIDGCFYFVPASMIPERTPPGLQYGYSLRGNRRKTERLSSRFTTQAGKFRYHPNFYVKNCAERTQGDKERMEEMFCEFDDYGGVFQSSEINYCV